MGRGLLVVRKSLPRRDRTIVVHAGVELVVLSEAGPAFFAEVKRTRL